MPKHDHSPFAYSLLHQSRVTVLWQLYLCFDFVPVFSVLRNLEILYCIDLQYVCAWWQKFSATNFFKGIIGHWGRGVSHWENLQQYFKFGCHISYSIFSIFYISIQISAMNISKKLWKFRSWYFSYSKFQPFSRRYFMDWGSGPSVLYPYPYYSRPSDIRPSFMLNFKLKMTILLEYFKYRCAFY